MRPQRWLKKLSFWVRLILHRREVDQELDDEIRDHIEAKAEENISKGMAPEEARRNARIELGGVEQMKETLRSVRPGAWLDTLAQDSRFGLRMLGRSPGFTAAAVLTLALGIGANTAIFSILYPLLLRSLPVREPEQLVFVGAGGINQGDYDTAKISEEAAFHRYRDENRVFSGVLAFTNLAEWEITREDQTGGASGELVSANYFNLLGIRPFIGRLFQPEDGVGGTGTPVAVLSYDYWKRACDSNPAVLRQSISIQNTSYSTNPISGQKYIIIGVAPPGFFGMEVGPTPDVYVPMGNESLAEGWVTIIGRLKPEVTLAQARSSLEPIFEENVKQSSLPPIELKQDMARLVVTPAGRGLSALRSQFSLPTEILMGIVGLILLIACANVANLLLTRGLSRQREIAVRVALGAGRWRIVRQLLTESALLACAGAVAGAFAGNWAAKLLLSMLSTKQLPVTFHAELSPIVLLFTACILVSAVILCGVIPALAATRAGMAGDLRTQAGGGTYAASRHRLAKAMVSGQVALSIAVLVGGGLLLQSLVNLETYNVGFDKDHVLAIRLNGHPSSTGFYSQLIERAKNLPGVSGAGYSTMMPVGGQDYGVTVTLEGREIRSATEAHALWAGVSPGYFNAMGIPLLAGHDFTAQDLADKSSVAVINRTMAKHYFGDENAVGKRFKFGEGNRPPVMIVGVVADSTYSSEREQPSDVVYIPASVARVVEVRTYGAPALLANAMRQLVQSLDSGVNISGIDTLRQQVNESLHQDRLIAALAAGFSVLALALASVGLYGLLAYDVTRRTKEIGVRMALGAQRGTVLTMVIREGLSLAGLGIIIGAACALPLTRFLRTLLFEITPTDPATFVGVALFFAIVALVACYLPARRAINVDPVVALRYE